MCIGNSRLAFSVSLAFAAAMVGLLKLEGGGFHLVGESSIGKTTALVVANSVWRREINSWRATDNALEGTAAEHCHSLLALDELSQVEPRVAGATAYMLANGKGKGRSDRKGAPRDRAEWLLLFLSTGEQTLADKVVEDGRQRTPRAGQAVRLIEIPADAGAGLGLFEDLHGSASGEAFVERLRAMAAEYHGTPARAFLETVAADLPRARAFMKNVMAEFVADNLPADASGQVKRVTERFALVAATGEPPSQSSVVAVFSQPPRA